jgi:CRP/FNR family cyclic AMP-dependent transcriptional regulator
MRKALYILGTLDDVDVEWLSKHGAVCSTSPGSQLIQQGKPIEHLYILLEGELSVSIGSGKGVEIARLQSGEIVGEMSFVDSRPPSASVFATQESHLLALRKDVLSAKLQKDNAFSSRFYRAIAIFLADRLHVTTGRLGYGGPEQDVDVDQIEDSAMEDVSLANIRFDGLLRQLRGDYRARGAGASTAP